MNNIFNCLSTHLYVLIKTPKGWIKYMWFCVCKKKLPETKFLQRIIMLNHIAKSLRNK